VVMAVLEGICQFRRRDVFQVHHEVPQGIGTRTRATGKGGILMRPYIQTYEDAVEVLEDYKRLRPKLVAVDTETTGLNWMKDDLFLIQVGWGNTALYAFPKRFAHLVRPIIEDENSAKVFHNAKFDMHMLERAGIKVAGQIHDTNVMARLLLRAKDSLKLKDLSIALVDPKANEQEIVLNAWM